MFPIRLLMLGPMMIELANQDRPVLRRKTRALLAYLAAADVSHSRQHLMTVFCAEAENPPAVLRSLFSRLRRNLDADILLVNDEYVRLNPAICWVDYRNFCAALSSGESVANSALVEILDLHNGELLADLSLSDAPEFEMWLLAERTRCQSLYERGLATAVANFITESAWDQAIVYAQRLVAENPLLEEAHGRLMWLYAQTGQLDAAHAQYQQCRTLLATELAVEPAAELRQLFEDIQGGKVRPEFALTMPQPTQLTVMPATTLIGRNTELAHLQQAWQQAQTGQGQAILIEAEAGGGKTHLLHAFGRELGPTQFLYGEGYESAQSIPYTPWLELLELVLGPYTMEQLANLPGDVRTAVAQLVPAKSRLSHEPPLPTERLYTVLAAFLLQDQPRLLFIDNLQWADSATLGLFHFLARRVAQAPVVLVGAYRPAPENQQLTVLIDDLQQQAAHLRLQPLQDDEIVSLLAEQWPKLPEAARPHMAEMLCAATTGNPLFLTEIVRELAHTTAVPETLPVPPSVLDLIMRRLRRFPPNVQQVIESLAVLHAPGTVDLLHQISGRSEDETAVAFDIALQQGLITPHTGESTADLYDFHHDLMRDAVILLLSRVRRRLLHKRAALALQSTARAAVLAYHWQKAGNNEQESIYAAQAGADADAVYANEEAIHFLLRAIELSPQSGHWLQLGEVYRRTGEWEQAEDAYHTALKLAEDETDRARAQFFLGRLLALRARYQDALPFYNLAENHFSKLTPSREFSEILNGIAWLYYRQSDYEPALRYFRHSLAVAEAVDDRYAIAVRIGNIGLVHLDRGELELAQDHLEESLRQCRELDHPEAIANRLGNLGIVYSYRRNHIEALAYYQEAVEIDRSLENKEAVARHLGNMATAYHHLGNYPEAITCYAEALQMELEMGNRRGLAMNVGNLGELFRELGEFDLSEKYLCWSLYLDIEAKHPEAIIRHLSNLGVIQAEKGNLTSAHALVTKAIHFVNTWQIPQELVSLLIQAGSLALQRIELDSALAYFKRAEESAAEIGQQDLLIEAQARSIPLRVTQKQLLPEEGKAKIQVLLNETTLSEKEQALLWEAMWRVTQEPSHARQAAQKYAALYRSMLLYEYRQRYFACTGEQLPVQPLPAFPNISVPENLPPLHDLLAQVDLLINSA